MSDPKVNVRAEEADARIEIRVSNDGKDGYTPKRGVDYWTEEDQQEIRDYVDERISAGGGGGGGVGNGIGIPSGGKAGQFLRKQSDKDYDVAWADFEIPYTEISNSAGGKTVIIG